MHKWRIYCGGLTDIVALKTNDPYCYFPSGQQGKKGTGGQAPEKLLEARFFHLRETPFDIERALQKGHFCSFAEKGRGLDPQDLPPVARLSLGLNLDTRMR